MSTLPRIEPCPLCGHDAQNVTLSRTDGAGASRTFENWACSNPECAKHDAGVVFPPKG